MVYSCGMPSMPMKAMTGIEPISTARPRSAVIIIVRLGNLSIQTPATSPSSRYGRKARNASAPI